MDNLTTGDLTIEAIDSANPIKLTWRGKSNERQPNKSILPFMAGVFVAASEKGGAVEMHFEKLEHFNSATITTLIQIIQDARSKGVKLTLVYDQALKWQKLSFDALRVFAKDHHLEIRTTS